MRDIADKAEPVTGADRLGPKFSQTLMSNCPGLEITDVVWRVVHELHMPDPPPVRLLEPFDFPLEKVETLHIGDNCVLSRLVGRFEIRGIQHAVHTMIGDQLVHPGEAVEAVTIKLGRYRLSHKCKGPPRAAAQHGPVRPVDQASARQRYRTQ